LTPNPVIVDSILSGNAAPTAPDLALPAPVTAQTSFSLIQNTSGATISSAVAGSNIFGVDPLLGPLQNNGGRTLTMKPASNSSVVDKGTSSPTCHTPGGRSITCFDQRFSPRPFDVSSVSNSVAAGANGADIGAVELQANEGPFPLPPPAVTHKKKKCKKKHKKHASVAKKKKCKKKKKKK
jgi:hypothetical protein